MIGYQQNRSSYEVADLAEIHEVFESVAQRLLQAHFEITDFADASQVSFRKFVNFCAIRSREPAIAVRVCFAGDVQTAVDDYRFYLDDCPDCELLIVSPDWLRPHEWPRLPAGIVLWDAQKLFRAGMLPYVTPGHFNLGVAHIEREIARALNDGLDTLPAGDAWRAYEQLVEDILLFAFSPDISLNRSQSSDQWGINRRDTVFCIEGSDPFWVDVRLNHARSHLFVVEAKNLSGRPSTAAVKQIKEYLLPHGIGMFGIIVSRQPVDELCFQYALNLRAGTESRTVIWLHDGELRQLLHNRSNGDWDASRLLLRAKIQDLMHAAG